MTYDGGDCRNGLDPMQFKSGGAIPAPSDLKFEASPQHKNLSGFTQSLLAGGTSGYKIKMFRDKNEANHASGTNVHETRNLNSGNSMFKTANQFNTAAKRDSIGRYNKN